MPKRGRPGKPNRFELTDKQVADSLKRLDFQGQLNLINRVMRTRG
jgi:hypothetical protein